MQYVTPSGMDTGTYQLASVGTESWFPLRDVGGDVWEPTKLVRASSQTLSISLAKTIPNSFLPSAENVWKLISPHNLLLIILMLISYWFPGHRLTNSVLQISLQGTKHPVSGKDQ